MFIILLGFRNRGRNYLFITIEIIQLVRFQMVYIICYSAVNCVIHSLLRDVAALGRLARTVHT